MTQRRNPQIPTARVPDSGTPKGRRLVPISYTIPVPVQGGSCFRCDRAPGARTVVVIVYRPGRALRQTADNGPEDWRDGQT